MANRSVEISNDTTFPIHVHTWTVRREGNEIVCRTTSRANGAHKKSWRFPVKEGTLYLFNSSSNAFAYFREKAFDEMLSLWGAHRFRRRDPNGVHYLGTSVMDESGNSEWRGNYFLFDSDGKVTRLSEEKESVPLPGWDRRTREDVKVKVEGATWLLIVERRRYDGNSYQSITLVSELGVEDLVTAAEGR